MNDCRIWKIQKGAFLPFDIVPSQNSNQVVSAIKQLDIPKNTSIYLRGSFLETDILHPNSDVDLVIISETSVLEFIQTINTHLAFINRPIEIVCLSSEDLHLSSTYRLLLHTRSLHIAGPEVVFDPVLANLETMRGHYFHYKPHMLAATLSLSKPLRIMQLKQITRSYGILHFMLDGSEFSRDIPTCLKWANQMNKQNGAELIRLWDTVDSLNAYMKEDLSVIKSVFLENSKLAMEMFK